MLHSVYMVFRGSAPPKANFFKFRFTWCFGVPEAAPSKRVFNFVALAFSCFLLLSLVLLLSLAFSCFLLLAAARLEFQFKISSIHAELILNLNSSWRMFILLLLAHACCCFLLLSLAAFACPLFLLLSLLSLA